ncbi:hypothetical protein KO524_11640, partial [Flavobacterium sp. NKUCC04_CG]|nr:hypothetical protein [Flavobacterium sp. NKUCC04_CG]
MKKVLIPAALLFTIWGTYAQVGIGTIKPNSSAQLDVVSSNSGILIPRVKLKSTIDGTTIENGNVNSMLVFNTATAENLVPGYYYWYNDKWLRVINAEDLSGLKQGTQSTSLLVDKGNLQLTDNEGNIISISISSLNIVTKLVNNQNGTYTYTNEEGIAVTLDVKDSVIKNFQEILNDDDVLNELIRKLQGSTVSGNLIFNGTTFKYSDNEGNSQTLTLAELVKTHETLTTLTKGNAGTYTYKSENNSEVVIDVVGDVSSNFDSIANNPAVLEKLKSIIKSSEGPVTFDGTAFKYSDSEGNSQTLTLAELVKTHETLTTLTKGNAGTYT